MDFKKHKRKGALSELIQVQEYISQVGDDFDKVSISEPDKKLDFETFKQGFIARNPDNHNDMWYISKEYYDKNLEEVEEPKQETLEEAAEKDFNILQKENLIVPDNHIWPFKLGYIKGAKRQAERMYSEEEMIEFYLFCITELLSSKSSAKSPKELFEQFKKN
jgi:hypothetical protein